MRRARRTLQAPPIRAGLPWAGLPWAGLVWAGLLCVGLPAQARAQADVEDRWIVLPASLRGSSLRAAEGAAYAAEALRASGERVLYGEQLAAALDRWLEATAPEAAPPVVFEDLRSLGEEIEASLGRRRYAAIQQRLAEELPRFLPYLPSINRDPETAVLLETLCGRWIEASLVLGDEPSADLAALQCLQLSPGLHPDEEGYARPIAPLIASIRAQTPGALRLRGAGESCIFRVNGAEVGGSPGARVALPRGDHVVQIECGGEVGRWHRVRVEHEEQILELDGRLEAVFRADPELAAVYPQASARRALPRDLATLCQRLGCDRALVLVEGDESWELRSFALRGAEASARAVRPLSSLDEEEIREAAEEMRSLRPTWSGASRHEPGSLAGRLTTSAGLLTLFAGFMVGEIASATEAELRIGCVEGEECAPATGALADEAEALSLSAEILYIGGAALTVGGLLLLSLLDDDADPETELSALCLPGACGAHLRARF